MIQEFRVTNFGSIREEQAISFVPSKDTQMVESYTHEVRPGTRLLKIGILYGSNASGKTTVLEALDFFREMMVRKPAAKSDGMGFAPFLLDAESRHESSRMEMTFYLQGRRHVLTITFNTQRITEEKLSVYTTTQPSLVYRRTYDEATDHSQVVFGGQAGLSSQSKTAIAGNTTNNCSVVAACASTNVERSPLSAVSDYFREGMAPLLFPSMSMLSYVKMRLKNTSDRALKPFILQLMKASDFNIADIGLEEHETPIDAETLQTLQATPMPEQMRNSIIARGVVRHQELTFAHSAEGGTYTLGEEQESRGTQRFIGMAMLLYRLVKGNVFIPIDEVEASLHYELLRYFIQLFLYNSEGSSQLLLTTHDLSLLDEDFIRRDVIYFTDKDSAGATSIRRLSHMGLHNTLSPYNAYRQGKLVNLPFLGTLSLHLND